MKHFLNQAAAVLLSWGPLGIFVLAVADSAGIPIPEGVDALVVLMAALSPRDGALGAALASAGSVAGSLVLYYIGKKGGHEYLLKRTERGWALKFRLWYEHYGLLTVFIPALIPAPLPMKIFVLSAGAFEINRAHFVLVVLIARIARYGSEAYLGAQLGSRPWTFLEHHKFQLLGASVALFVFLYVLIRLKDRLERRKAVRSR